MLTIRANGTNGASLADAPVTAAGEDGMVNQALQSEMDGYTAYNAMAGS